LFPDTSRRFYHTHSVARDFYHLTTGDTNIW
jgi:hypothetical protein